jgi:4,5-DOPA dioxygenase extradiol
MKRTDFLKWMGLAPILGGMKNLNDLNSFSQNLSLSEKMPLLFLGHGSPMNAIEENEFVFGFREISKTLPLPKAIICISAHWFTKGTKVTAMEMPRTIHDFYGFPEELYNIQYPAKGNPELAVQTKNLLQPTLVELDEKWGLDHGAWSVIKHLYPNANIPVIQLSIDNTKNAAYHFQLAKQLNSLREKGILMVGSGNIIHNLRLVDFANMNKDNYGYDWAVEAREKLNNYILDNNFKPLLTYENLGQAFRLAVPTPEHYLPLIYILGMKQEKEEIQLFNDKLLAGSLSMTSLKIA